ncbi:MAG: phosphotransferase [Candidatus Latescibacteria bacterium]|nr:phosphotransferase [Candidatus Latescibacterota bacterium]
MWTTDVRGILLHPTEAKAWLLADPEGYRLPGFTFGHAEGVYLPNQFDGALIPGLREVYGCDLYLLRQVAEWQDFDSQRAKVVCVLEMKEGQPTKGEWMDIQTTSLQPFNEPEHGQLVRQALSELGEEGVTPPQCPWQRRGWFRQAVRWIEQELPRLGYGPVTNIEQGRATNNSAILRAHSSQGVFYFKAVADVPWLANESVVVDTLATHYPHLIPKPICTDTARRWMLTAEFGPLLNDPERDQEVLVRAVYAYGQMQLDSVAHTTDLLATDLFGYDLDRFSSKVEALVRESAVEELLESEDITKLRHYLSLVDEYSRRLTNSSIPQTIVHGDFTIHNIARRNGDPLVFDWTSASISFPFFDMVELLRHREVETIHSDLKMAYLSAWTGCAPISELEKLWVVAEPLGFLFMALHFRAMWGDYLPLGEPIPYFLRRAIRSIEEN